MMLNGPAWASSSTTLAILPRFGKLMSWSQHAPHSCEAHLSPFIFAQACEQVWHHASTQGGWASSSTWWSAWVNSENRLIPSRKFLLQLNRIHSLLIARYRNAEDWLVQWTLIFSTYTSRYSYMPFRYSSLCELSSSGKSSYSTQGQSPFWDLLTILFEIFWYMTLKQLTVASWHFLCSIGCFTKRLNRRTLRIELAKVAWPCLPSLGS